MFYKPSIPIWSHMLYGVFINLPNMAPIRGSNGLETWAGCHCACGRRSASGWLPAWRFRSSTASDKGIQRWDLTRQFRRFDDDLMMILFGIKTDNPCGCFSGDWSQMQRRRIRRYMEITCDVILISKPKNDLTKIHGDTMWSDDLPALG